MHRVHHSWHREETNSNFGFNHPWWDRLMGTYQDQPADGHTQMTIGLTEFRDERQADRLHRMLWLPLTQDLGDYPVNRAKAKPPASNTGDSPAQQLDSSDQSETITIRRNQGPLT
jgi:hypothetical protein